MIKKWKPIDDSKIQSLWECEEKDCCKNEKCLLSPTYYQDSGTPICSNGVDMIYQHTEIYQ